VTKQREEVAKSRQTAEREEDEMSRLVESDHDGFSDSDEENDEWLMST
jgi:hypothetical protein